MTVTSIFTSNALKNADPGNVALVMALGNSYYISTIVVVGVGLVIGYFIYPPAVIISCLVSTLMVWLWPLFKKYF
ncbi:MAG: hypothetical protein IJF83_02550 [Methanobrevibacter sp.]|nr:hypothetical protein [Methanobrevibacter sp.]